MRLNELIHIKHLKQCLAHREHSVNIRTKEKHDLSKNMSHFPLGNNALKYNNIPPIQEAQYE